MDDILNNQIENQHTLDNLGIMYMQDGFFDEAKVCFENALKFDGNYRSSLYNLAIINLLKGDLKNGLAGYEYRNKIPFLSTRGKLPPSKSLNKLEKIAGKKVFVYLEKEHVLNLKEMILFSRYLNLLKKFDCKIILDCPSELVCLFKESFPFIEKFNPLFAKYDYHIPLLGLAKFFSEDFNSIPFKNSYIKPNEMMVAKYKNTFFKTNLAKIGIFYQENPSVFCQNSINPLFFEDIFELENAQFYSFQNKTQYRNYKLIDLNSTFKNYSYVAAALSCLDLFITTDTTLAHLAGSINVPTWVLLPIKHQWYWFLNQSTSPWYNSVKLYRQKELNVWGREVSQVKDDLNMLLM